MDNTIYFKSPYLIQRLLKPTTNINPFSFGIGYKNGGLSPDAMKLLSPIFSFDYMGSAEFEFGALPVAFGRIAKNPEQHTSGCIDIKNDSKIIKQVYFICHKDIKQDVIKFIAAKGKKEHCDPRTKERIGLYDAINDSPYSRTYGWIDLDNSFMFFTDKDMFEKTAKLFEINIK